MAKKKEPTYKEIDVSLKIAYASPYIALINPSLEYIKRIHPLMEEQGVFMFIFLTKSVKEARSVNWMKDLPKSHYIVLPMYIPVKKNLQKAIGLIIASQLEQKL